MSLMELCRSLESTLAQLDAARRGAQDGEAIDQRTQQWTERLAELQSARQRADWLQIDLSQVANYPAQFEYTRRLAQEAAQRLEQRAEMDALTEEGLWARLLQTAQTAAGGAWEEVKRAWRIKVEEFHQLTPLQQLRATASPLPQNGALLAAYEVHHRAASRLAGLEAPKSPSDPETLAQAINTCKALSAQLDFHAPEEIAVFFRALNAGGASLALVTPTVLAWIADNDQLDRYVVRSIGR